MNEFTKKLITGNPRALLYAKSLLTDPTLVFTINGAKVIIPLEVETISQDGEAEVSEQVVVTKEGKKYISDNVAPGPWSWTMSGYISGIEALEVTNFYTPGLRLNIEFLKKAFKDGLRGFFKDQDCWPYNNVVIQRLSLGSEKDCKNKKPFQMTLKQIEVLSSLEGVITSLAALSSPGAGSIGGDTLGAGQTTTSPVERLKESRLAQFFLN